MDPPSGEKRWIRNPTKHVFGDGEVFRACYFALHGRSVTAIVESGHRQWQEARRPTNYQFIEEKGAHKRTHPPVFSSRLTAFSSKELPFSIALWLTEPGELH